LLHSTLSTQIVEPDEAERIGYILGPGSAYGQAVKEFAERKAQGQDVVIVKSSSYVLVVPRDTMIDGLVEVRDGARRP
jgi:hypothetical protein